MGHGEGGDQALSLRRVAAELAGLCHLGPPGQVRRGGSQDGEGKTGAAMLAIRTGVPILPVYITPERKLFQRTKVYIGEPYMPFTEKRRANAEDYERVTEDIMEHIRAIRDTRAEREAQG